MFPTIGRIIHVNGDDPTIPCRAAIVGALDYGKGEPFTVYAAVVNVHNNVNPVTVIVLRDALRWHDPRNCTNTLYDAVGGATLRGETFDPFALDGEQ